MITHVAIKYQGKLYEDYQAIKRSLDMQNRIAQWMKRVREGQDPISAIFTVEAEVSHPLTEASLCLKGAQ